MMILFTVYDSVYTSYYMIHICSTYRLIMNLFRINECLIYSLNAPYNRGYKVLINSILNFRF